jgi:hypothetical protein
MIGSWARGSRALLSRQTYDYPASFHVVLVGAMEEDMLGEAHTHPLFRFPLLLGLKLSLRLRLFLERVPLLRLGPTQHQKMKMQESMLLLAKARRMRTCSACHTIVAPGVAF